MPVKGPAPKDPRRPVAVWSSKDLLDGHAVGSLTIILRTRGCRWNMCSMCGYASEGAAASSEDLLYQLKAAMSRLSSMDQVVKIYTSGSFFDPVEVPSDARLEILRTVSNAGIRKLVVESRPQYITQEAVRQCADSVELEVGIGLETASDPIRDHVVRKGFKLQDFIAASQLVHGSGGRVKAYLLLKPPFLSEGAAIRDAISSMAKASQYADVLSLNLCNVQRGTDLEGLWERGEYRPPWLWSAVEVLRKSGDLGIPVICDPVAAGSQRGPHNCGLCDELVANAIKAHLLEQDVTIFDSLDCSCIPTWRKLLELEERSFGSLLV